MKALILASGEGRRMMPLTNDIPKCLIDVNDDTILDYEIKAITAAGVNDIIITTGPFDEKVREHMKNKYPSLKVSYVKNPDYTRTNYIYSIWLAREILNDDIIVLHGDLLFDTSLLNNLLRKDGSWVPLNNKIKPPQKDFKGRVVDGKVLEIGTHVFGEGCYFLAPLYKLTKHDLGKWLEEIGKFVQDNNIRCYAEDAFNRISDEIDLKAFFYQNEFCMEVDDKEDLEKARGYLGG